MKKEKFNPILFAKAEIESEIHTDEIHRKKRKPVKNCKFPT